VTNLPGEALKLWRALVAPGASAGTPAPPGTIVSVDHDGVSVACGVGVLRLTELQRAGGKRLPLAEFLRGFAIQPGAVLGSVP
jgi:methionyl-tRNA formyltransferase